MSDITTRIGRFNQIYSNSASSGHGSYEENTVLFRSHLLQIIRQYNIKSILDHSNLKILSFSKNEYHGGSLRTIASKKNSSLKELKIDKFINYENKKNIYKLEFYKKMMKKINFKKKKLLTKLSNLSAKGYILSGIGAGAKSNTFLTFYELNNKIIKFLTDSSKFKKNKYTPVSRIIIKDDKELINHKKIACIILSWNISILVIDKIKKLNKKIKIIYT